MNEALERNWKRWNDLPPQPRKAKPTQKERLFEQFGMAGSLGLTDEEAAQRAGLLDVCYWRRCSELRAEGLIGYADDGEMRTGKSGVKRQVSAITAKGMNVLFVRATSG